MKIKLKCQTGGFKYGDVVDTSKVKSITEDIAKGLVAEDLAELLEVEPEAEVKPKKGKK